MRAQTLRKVRLFHNYIAVFFAPAILFFAFTGGLQTAGLHEAHGAYSPPRWVAAIASLHQHQVIAGGHHAHHDDDRHPAVGTPGVAPAHDDDHDRGGFIPEKPFVLLLAIALFVTTALGLVIAVATPSTRRTSLMLIVAGIVVPVALLLV